MEDIQFLIFELALIPVIMICFGLKFMKAPPKNKESFFAYKTDRATKNDETWTFAHRYIGWLWFRLGIATAVITAIIMVWAFLQGGATAEITAGTVCIAHLIPLVLSIFLTERALKKCFDQYGNRIDFDDKVDKDYT